MAAICVIVPVYKVEPYLHRCVDSILNQTFTNFELILVDDGSPDNCGVICDEYAAKDSRVHVIHQKNGGLSAARNAGLARAFANGCQWVAFVDSDDWVHPCYLEILHGAAVENGVMLSCCEFCPVQEEAGELNDVLPEMIPTVIKSPEEVFFPQDKGILCYCWRWLFHISLLQKNQFPEGRLWEDVYVLPQIIFRTEQVAAVDAVLYYYFRRYGSITLSAWSEKKLDILYSFEHCLRTCEKVASKSLCVLVANVYISNLLEQNDQIMMSVSCGAEKVRMLLSVRNRLKKEIKQYGNQVPVLKNMRIRIFCILHPPLYGIYLKFDKLRAILHDRFLYLQNTDLQKDTKGLNK